MAMNLLGCLAQLLADSWNCVKHIGIHIPNSTLHAEMRRCHGELHKWRTANQLSFDPTKQIQHILTLNGCDGLKFRMVRIQFAHALSMRDAVMQIVTEGSWKVSYILRCTRFCADGQLVNLYKSQSLSYFESKKAAINHACNIVLAFLNKFQKIRLS